MTLFIPCNICSKQLILDTNAIPSLSVILKDAGWTNDGLYSYCDKCKLKDDE